MVPYETAKLWWPNLRVSPLGVVPQRDRRPRLIVDYSFSGLLNAETLSWAPRDESMQFGRALQMIFTKILKADPRYGAVHMAKIDVVDGFYRVWVRLDDVSKLSVALPTTPGSPPSRWHSHGLGRVAALLHGGDRTQLRLGKLGPSFL